MPVYRRHRVAQPAPVRVAPPPARKAYDISLTVAPATAHDLTEIHPHPIAVLENWAKHVLLSERAAFGLERGNLQGKLHLHAAITYTAVSSRTKSLVTKDIKAEVRTLLNCRAEQLSINVRYCSGKGMGTLPVIAVYAMKERFRNQPGAAFSHYGFTEQELQDAEIVWLQRGKGLGKNKVLLHPKDLFDKMGMFWQYRMDCDPKAEFTDILMLMMQSELYVCSGEFGTHAINIIKGTALWRLTRNSMLGTVRLNDVLLGFCRYDADLREHVDWDELSDDEAEGVERAMEQSDAEMGVHGIIAPREFIQNRGHPDISDEAMALEAVRRERRDRRDIVEEEEDQEEDDGESGELAAVREERRQRRQIIDDDDDDDNDDNGHTDSEPGSPTSGSGYDGYDTAES